MTEFKATFFEVYDRIWLSIYKVMAEIYKDDEFKIIYTNYTLGIPLALLYFAPLIGLMEKLTGFNARFLSFLLLIPLVYFVYLNEKRYTQKFIEKKLKAAETENFKYEWKHLIFSVVFLIGIALWSLLHYLN